MTKTRVFITGFSPCHCRPKKTRTRIWNPTDAIEMGLTELGYAVKRSIGFGVTVDDFDVLSITPGSYGSITSDYGPHALVLMYQALMAGKPVFTIVEDWQYPKFNPNFRKLAMTDADRVSGWLNWKIKCRGEGKLGYAHIRDNQAYMIRAMADLLGSGDWPTPICATLPWCDRHAAAAAIDTVPEKVWWIDPSPLYPVYPTPVPFMEREREWVLATLYDFRPWVSTLGLTWPMRCIGKKVGGKVMHEVDVVKSYARSWGVLAPKTRWSKLGIWRARYTHAARARCVLLVEREMMDKIGPPYRFDPKLVEKLPASALDALAEDQASRFWALSGTREDFLRRLQTVMATLDSPPNRRGA